MIKLRLLSGVKGGGIVSLIRVGVMALRKPDGEFLPSTPIYREISEDINKSGLSKADEYACKDISLLLAEKFKSYIDEMRKKGIKTDISSKGKEAKR